MWMNLMICCALCSKMKTDEILLVVWGTHLMRGGLRMRWTSLAAKDDPGSCFSQRLRISAISQGNIGMVVLLSSVDQPMYHRENLLSGLLLSS